MRIDDIEKKEYGLLFTIEVSEVGKPASWEQVKYFDIGGISSCLCVNCREIRCAHTEYIQALLDTNLANQIMMFIKDFTGWLPSPEYIGKMQRAFDKAAGKYGVLKEARRRERDFQDVMTVAVNKTGKDIKAGDVVTVENGEVTKIKKPRKPKPKPARKPFGMIELD